MFGSGFLLTSLVWFYLFAVLTIILFLLVPKDEIINLLPFGLLAGFVLALLLQYFAIHVFKWWKFNYALIKVFNAPLGVSLSWVPAVMIFAYFWPLAISKLGKLIYVFIFAFGTTIVEYSFVLLGYRKYINWNVGLTFILAFGIHLLLASYLYLTTVKDEIYSQK